MNDNAYIALTIIVMGGVTFAIRALPFLGARWLDKHPQIKRLGAFLPLSIMVLLTGHTLLDIGRSYDGNYTAEGIAIAVVIALQWWQRKALLSIGVGTLIYLVIRNVA